MAVLLTNNASSTLASSITTGATTLAIQTGDAGKFPSPANGDWFPIRLVDAAGNMEIVRCTGRSAATLTIQRAQEGTTARAFAAGSRADLSMTAGTFAAMADTIEAEVLAGLGSSYVSSSQLTDATLRATTSEIRARTSGKLVEADELFAAADPVQASGQSGTLSFDFNNYIDRELTATGNLVFGVVTNAKPGTSGVIEIIHSGAARTVSVNTTYWATPLGGLVLSTVAGARDLLGYYVSKSGKIYVSVIALGVA